MPTRSKRSSASARWSRWAGGQSARRRRRCEISAIWTFSATVIEPKVAVIWKVRPTPVVAVRARPLRPASLGRDDQLLTVAGEVLGQDVTHVDLGRPRRR